MGYKGWKGLQSATSPTSNFTQKDNEVQGVECAFPEDCVRPMTRDARLGTWKLLNKYWFHFLHQVVFYLVLETVVCTH